MEFVPQFSYSLEVQARNPKKIYTIDTGFIQAVSTSFTDDMGRKLENLVYLHLRRHYKEVYYYKQEGECNFVACRKGKAEKAIQVCYRVDDGDFDRETKGLLDAMKALKLAQGIIVTADQRDVFEMQDSTVHLIPAFEYLTATNTDFRS